MKMVQKATVAMSDPYQVLLEHLPKESQLNADETGHKDNANRWWTWVFRSPRFTVFRVSSSRGSQVLDNTLGSEFAGFLGADYFSAYRKDMKNSHALVQFCLAHLVRDVRFLCDAHDTVTANYGQRLLTRLGAIFKILHRKETMTPHGFQRRLKEERDRFLATAKRPPPLRDAEVLAARFRKHGNEYFRFVTTPGLEPTNNAAEQAIRFCVIDRRITQGTRSANGRAWCERIWTAVATCNQQGRSLFLYLCAAIDALFLHQHPPSLLV